MQWGSTAQKLTLDFNQQEDKVYDNSMTLDNFHLQEQLTFTRPLNKVKVEGMKAALKNRII